MAPQPLQESDPAQIGRYQLTARLGAGGMGVVYLARAGDGRQIAVKVLRPEYADDAEFRARFRREVAAMTRVRNRYTVQVLDADTESAMPFLATEFADGPSLDEHVRARGPLHPGATIRLAAALAEALAAIHAAGVTHRDLKPSNVLLTGRGPMVIDFGIAQVADSVSITRTGMAIGSPGYMAPEQLTGRAGREADIFTWALVIAFAASGQPPFGTGATVAILQRILNDRPDFSAVPPQLMPLVQAALAKDPKRRPEAADLLRELSPGSTVAMVPPTAVDRTAVDRQMTRNVRDDGLGAPTRVEGPGQTRTLYGESGPRQGPGPRRRLLGPAIVAAAIVAVLAGVGAALLANGGPSAGNSNARGGKGLAPATAPALSGTARRAGAGAGLPTASRRRRHHAHPGLNAPAGQVSAQDSNGGNPGGTGGGNANAGNGNQGANVPANSPSASPSASPSVSVSPVYVPGASPGPSTSPTASAAASPAASPTASPTASAAVG